MRHAHSSARTSANCDDAPRRQLLSIVIPCFNEQEVIERTYRVLIHTLADLPMDVEILCVNDGSRDQTWEILLRLAANDPRVRPLNLSRNFGHQVAVTAGIDQARGDAVVLIDADLQDPPEVILEMVQKWREGYDVAFGRRAVRTGETRFKLWTAGLFYRLINRLADIEIPLDTGDFRLMDRKVVDALRRMPERDRFLRGMVSWVGFRQTEVRYDRAPRAGGETKYPLRKMLRLALDGIVSFSLVPLRGATFLGLAATALGLAGILLTAAVGLSTASWAPGSVMLFIGMLFLGGAQLVCLGVIGEYVGRIYMELKRRPLYLLSPAEKAEPEVPEVWPLRPRATLNFAEPALLATSDRRAAS